MNAKEIVEQDKLQEERFIGYFVEYYKKAFSRIRSGKWDFIPVWEILVFGSLWLLYRKMPSFYIIYTILTSLIIVLLIKLFGEPIVLPYVPLLVYLMHFVALSFLAKYIYLYRFNSLKKNIFSKCNTQDELFLALEKYGGTIIKPR
jgi:hypothetical protein